MPSSRVARRLRDVIENAHAVMRYTQDIDLAAFESNRLVYDAVERCLERISEAALKTRRWEVSSSGSTMPPA